MRGIDRDLIRGGHYGQRSCEPHPKAEHMAAPTNAANVKKALANSEPSTHGPLASFRGNAAVRSASLIGRLGSSAFRPSTTSVSMSPTGSRFSSESAQGPSIMGSEDEAEQSNGRPCRQTTAGPSGHASSPHPSSREGHHSTARWSSSFPPIGFDPAGSCGCGFPGPPELGAVNPYAVQDHGQTARQRHDRLL